jgi:hypothetical protein
MKTTIKFNTERQYSHKGQRIAARLLDNGSTVFVDVDRNIEGVIPVLCDAEFTASLFDRRYVMDAYDSNHYAMPYGEHDETIRELRALFNPEPAPVAPVQTEIEYDDGVDSHDYVVTGCHDEDNTEDESDADEKARKVWSVKLSYALSTGVGDDEAYAYADKETAAYRARNAPTRY